MPSLSLSTEELVGFSAGRSRVVDMEGAFDHSERPWQAAERPAGDESEADVIGVGVLARVGQHSDALGAGALIIQSCSRSVISCFPARSHRLRSHLPVFAVPSAFMVVHSFFW